MTLDDLHTLAHQIAYSTARSDIECFAQMHSDVPVESVAAIANCWYDLSAVIKDDFQRECVANAIFYLDARSLLRRKQDAPFLVQILPPLSSGALMPPTLAEALTA
jgi:hypothetical protein